jgi:hypothetical protein
MTNHPGRKRGDDEDQSPADALAADVPAVQEMADELAAQMPPGHTPNGVPPGLKPNAAKVIGETVAASLGQVLPDALCRLLPPLLYDAFATALSQVPVQAVTPQHFKCATCVTLRGQWGVKYDAELKAAQTAMAALLAQMAPDDLRRAQLNLLAFLPEEAQQAVPPINDGMVMTGGTVLCADHAPGTSSQPGRKEFLIAHGPLTPSLIADALGQPKAA